MSIIFKNVWKRSRGTFFLYKSDYTFQDGTVYGLKCPDRNMTHLLMYAICGIERLDKGKIMINDREVTGVFAPMENIGKAVGEPAFILGYTGLENLKTIASVHQCASENRIRETMIQMGMDPDDERTFGEYSPEWKKRLGIVAAVMEKPKIILLEEPYVGLSSDGKKCVDQILEEIKKQGALCIVSGADLEKESEKFHQMIEIREGNFHTIGDLDMK